MKWSVAIICVPSFCPNQTFLTTSRKRTKKVKIKMVKHAVSLAALAIYAVKLVSAAPGAAEASTTNFSFAKWVEDIIPNPDTASTVDEAIAAANAANVTGSAGGLQARAPY